MAEIMEDAEEEDEEEEEKQHGDSEDEDNDDEDFNTYSNTLDEQIHKQAREEAIKAI